jgi:FkbM family methyltransferase
LYRFIARLKHINFIIKRNVFLQKKSLKIQKIEDTFLLKDAVIFSHYKKYRSWDQKLVTKFYSLLESHFLNLSKTDNILVIDIGANQGLFSLQLNKLLQDHNDYIVDFLLLEPHPLYFFIASLNSSGYSNFSIDNYALCSKLENQEKSLPTKSVFFTLSNATSTFEPEHIMKIPRVPEFIHKVNVPIKTVENFCSQLTIDYPNYEYFIKIDIDGSDILIAMHFLKFLKNKIRCISFELTSLELSRTSTDIILNFEKIVDGFSDISYIGKSGTLNKEETLKALRHRTLLTGDIFLEN